MSEKPTAPPLPATTTSSTSHMSIAQRTFEIENDIINLDEDLIQRDNIYQYNASEQKALLAAKPWRANPNYFKNVRISSIALLKMVIHARSGGAIEVMGMMTGKIMGDKFVVMDAYPLPVEGTETRVNALGEAYEFIVQYLDGLNAVGRMENVVGWYHSHPGYGCWLSGIDVGTQSQNQQFQDPFLAIVIDPNRTISAGKVDIGVFRTYPEDYVPPQATDNNGQSIPLSKIEDFGVHANKYYALEVSYFKSSLDAKLLEILWNKYWVFTLSQSPLLLNHAYSTQQMMDIADKTKLFKISKPSLEASLMKSGVPGSNRGRSKKLRLESQISSHSSDNKYVDQNVANFNKIVNETIKISSEQINGLICRDITDRLFTNICNH